jgi:hypothetical protein
MAMAFNQHERHIGNCKGFEIQHRKHKHIIRAVGQSAISTAYDVLEQERKRRGEAKIIDALRNPPPVAKRWSVERRDPRGMWLTAERSMQGKTLEGALRLVRGMEDSYRVLVWTCEGLAPVELKLPRGN